MVIEIEIKIKNQKRKHKINRKLKKRFRKIELSMDMIHIVLRGLDSRIPTIFQGNNLSSQSFFVV